MKTQNKAHMKNTKIWKRATGYWTPAGKYMVRDEGGPISFRKDKSAAIRYAKKLGYTVEHMDTVTIGN